jgi:hypothetical protein
MPPLPLLGLGWSVPDRETFLRTVVSGGAAVLLAYAGFLWATDRASAQQVRGLAAAGVGFLMSAAAAAYLHDRAIVGAVVSLSGCVLALFGMRILLRDRLDRQDAARRARRGTRAE